MAVCKSVLRQGRNMIPTIPIHSRATFLLLCFFLLAGASSSRPSLAFQRTAGTTDTEQNLLVRAKALHKRMITIDSHAGFTSDPLRSCGATDLQVDFPKMKKGGLHTVFFTVWAAQQKRTPKAYAEAKRQALHVFEDIHGVVRRCGDTVGLARTPEEVERIVGSGRLAVVIGIENGFVMGKDLSLLKTYRELGAAYFGVTHDGHNDLADSATPSKELGDGESEHNGVSDLGEQVIRELNRLGIMVDVSHMSKAATLEAIRLSKAPIIASHSSMYNLVNHPRNMDDETLVALAKKGGIVQITAVSTFVKSEPPEATEAFSALFHEFGVDTILKANRLTPGRRTEFQRRYAELEKRWPLATVSDFVDHIDHAVKLAGVDHVGIGSDFEGGGELTGWADASETVNVTVELLRRGYSEEDIRKIWGGNLLRVWQEVQRLAEQKR
ncbi:MAG: dipeptidase [Acidobacteria bacterium]|nr:dipeptidase [Acidobacteriota bacterium]